MENKLSQTAILLQRINAGDEPAKNELAAHCYPILLKWAHGRIPYAELSLLDTTDLVQEAFIKGLKKVDRFESKRPGAFLAYLRQIFINCIRDASRRSQPTDEIEQFLNSRTQFSHDAKLDEFISYEQALSNLSKLDQEAVILRIEFGLSYQEIATAMDKPSADSARMQVNRALVKLTEFIE
ncbi:MAG: RNA polymerase sigma factor [Marinicella sp.]|nr:sigma-70 family RNA polymerase sigma factor [Xanthomonadales bacterium]